MSEKKTTVDLLNERGKTHGEYTEHARCTQAILKVISKERNWPILSDEQKEAIHMIAHKLGRISVGNPDTNDHWDDIAGYATLVSQRLPGSAGSHRTHKAETVPHFPRERRVGHETHCQDNPRGFDPELDTVAGDTNQ